MNLIQEQWYVFRKTSIFSPAIIISWLVPSHSTQKPLVLFFFFVSSEFQFMIRKKLFFSRGKWNSVIALHKSGLNFLRESWYWTNFSRKIAEKNCCITHEVETSLCYYPTLLIIDCMRKANRCSNISLNDRRLIKKRVRFNNVTWNNSWTLNRDINFLGEIWIIES